MEEKKCFKCNETKSVSEFYKHKGTSDGYLGKCKICTKRDTKIRLDELSLNDEWLQVEKARQRNKYHKLEYKDKYKPSSEMKRKVMLKYHDKYPEKRKARSKIRNLVKINSENELHHWSYNEKDYKDVIELSVAEHNLIHRFLNYDQDFKMYRDNLENLLNTKDKHLEYINGIINSN